MPRCLSRYWKVVPVLFLILLAMTPAASAQGGLLPSPVTEICGRVVNEVGWGLEGVEVMAIGTGFVSSAHLPMPSATTAADGTFSLGVVHDTYSLVFTDGEGRDERAGAVYQPRIENVDASSFDQLTQGGCDGPEERFAVELDDVTLPADGSDFFLADVTDRVDESALEDANVSVEVPDLELNLRWGGAKTDAEGVARLSCPSGLSFRLRIEKDDYQPTLSPDHTCGTGIGTIALDAWRTAVPVDGTATDDATKQPLPGADLTASPLDLNLTQGPGYTFNTTSSADGSWLLALPWGGQYQIEATRPGYHADDAVIDVDPDPPGPVDLRLPRKEAVFSGQVVDVTGAGIQATLDLDGPQTTEETDPEGRFHIELPFGEYDLTISSDGKNTRECELELPFEGDGPALDPAHCLVLIQDGKAAVEGLVVDGPTGLPVPGATFTIGDDDVLTGSDGSFILEADWQEEDYSLTESAYEPSLGSVSIPDQDSFVDLGTIPLDRLTIDVGLHAVSGGNPLADVEITAQGVAGNGTCTTANNGACTIGLPWTTRDGSYTDETGYDISGQRLSTAPLFDLQVCSSDEHVDFDAPEITCTLGPVAGLSTLIGPAYDAHDDEPVDGVDVFAQPVGLTGDQAQAACEGPYECQATTGPDGTAALVLPQGRTFNITYTHPGYQTTANLSVPAGEGVGAIGLFRVLTGVAVEVTDAHTSGTIEGALLHATGDAFTCDPESAGPCQATTGDDGNATLQLPWGDHLLNVSAGAYTVHAQVEEAAVQFQGTQRPLSVEMASAGGEKSETFDLVRAAGPGISGTVTDFRGAPLADARMSVHDVRGDGFVCNPDPDGTGGPFPDCDGIQPFGAYNLTLPHGTYEHHQWDLGVVHEDHHREDRLVAPGSEQDFRLWPLAFDLSIEVRDQQTNELLNFVNVCIKNLDQATPGDLSAFDCPGQTGAQPVPVVFENVTWIREGDEDTTDTFLVRAARSQYPEQVRVMEIGPAMESLVIRLQRVPPHAPEPDAPEPGRIHGIVQDADALLAEGVTGVRVTAQRLEGSCGDGSGTYESAAVAGAYQVLVGCPGAYLVQVQDPLGRYDATSAEVEVPAGEPLLGPISGLGEAQQDFLLERTLSLLEVQVLDAAGGEGVAGASVTITGTDVDHAAGPSTTGEDGSVRFVGVPWGSYEVNADAGEPDWLLGTGTSVGIAPPGGEGTAVVVLVGVEAGPECSPDENPQVCSVKESDPDVEMLSIETTGGETGAWSVFQPQLGQVATAADSASVAPMVGPHDGTWVIVFQPVPETSGTQDIEVRLSYTLDPLENRTLTASTMLAASVGPFPVHTPLVWVVNLHKENVAGCLPLQNECDGADPAHAFETRFFLPV